MKEVRDILANARALIATPDCWTRGANARDKHGRDVDCERPGATKFCMYGALMRATVGDAALGFYPLAVGALRRVSPDLEIYRFNDNPATTHSDVLARFDAAIAGELAREESFKT